MWLHLFFCCRFLVLPPSSLPLVPVASSLCFLTPPLSGWFPLYPAFVFLCVRPRLARLGLFLAVSFYFSGGSFLSLKEGFQLVCVCMYIICIQAAKDVAPLPAISSPRLFSVSLLFFYLVCALYFLFFSSEHGMCKRS